MGAPGRVSERRGDGSQLCPPATGLSARIGRLTPTPQTRRAAQTASPAPIVPPASPDRSLPVRRWQLGEADVAEVEVGGGVVPLQADRPLLQPAAVAGVVLHRPVV